MRYLELRACVVDRATGRLSHGRDGRLTTRELALLDALVARDGAVYPRVALLAEVFGYAPTASSRAVDKAMNSLRAKVEVSAAAPDHLVTVVGEGYRFVAGPEPDGVLVGRAHELAALRVAIERPGWTTVVGPGGIGKTRLVRALAPEAVFVDLVPARRENDVVRRVASALGIGIGDEVGAEQVASALRSLGPRLVVLDNVEQLAGAVSLFDRWLADTPGLRCLATSRALTGVQVERAFWLEPLAPADARALFLSLAEARGLSLAGDPAVPGLADRCDGLPLALELAAARLGTLGAAELAARLDERLTLWSADRDHRQRTLRATLEWSWAMLGRSERAALAELSVFPHHFSADAAEAVLSADPEAREPLDRLETLRATSWLRRRVLDGRVRLELGEATRLFVADQLGGAEEAAARSAHARHYAAVCEGARDSRDAVARLAREVEHLTVACDRACDTGDLAAALALLEGLRTLAVHRGPLGLLLERAPRLERLPCPTPHDRARLLRLVGVARSVTDPEGGARTLLAGAAAARSAGDPLEGELTGEAARALASAGATHEARELAEAGLSAATPEVRAQNARTLGRMALAEARYEEASRWFERARGEASAAGEEVLAANCLHNAAWAAIRLGRLDDALGLLDACDRVFDRFDMVPGRLHGRIARGHVHLARGEVEEGLSALRSAADGLAACGDLRGRMQAMGELGSQLLALGRIDEASAALAETEELARWSRDTRTVRVLQNGRVQRWLALGRPELAYDLAFRLRSEHDGPATSASLATGLLLVRASVAVGRPEQAAAAWAEVAEELLERGLGEASPLGRELVACRELLDAGA